MHAAPQVRLFKVWVKHGLGAKGSDFDEACDGEPFPSFVSELLALHVWRVHSAARGAHTRRSSAVIPLFLLMLEAAALLDPASETPLIASDCYYSEEQAMRFKDKWRLHLRNCRPVLAHPVAPSYNVRRSLDFSQWAAVAAAAAQLHAQLVAGDWEAVERDSTLAPALRHFECASASGPVGGGAV